MKRHIGTDWKKNISGKDYNRQEISAMILRKLRQDAEAYLGEPVKDAVITVPAYKDTGMEQSITITANEKMSEAEIQQAIRDAEMYASQDGIRRDIMDTTNEAQRLLAQVEQAMSKAGKQIEKEEKKRIKADQAALNKFMIKNKPDKMSEGDLMNLKAAMENLRMSSQHLLDMAQ